jgi:predicted amidophosphoribosyltransferase
MWTEVWAPNEQDFYDKYSPQKHADTILSMNNTVKDLLCPCCEQALRELDSICPICNWQFDGQDTSNADEVLGGPNGDLSLSKARQIFQKNRDQADL